MSSVRVVVDCGAPDKEFAAKYAQAQIVSLVDLARRGVLTPEQRDSSIASVMDNLSRTQASPDRERTVKLSGDELAQVERDRQEGLRSNLRRRRRERDALLAASDWTMLPDVPEAALLPVAREDWRLYRQALRDWAPGEDGSNPFPARPASPQEA